MTRFDFEIFEKKNNKPTLVSTRGGRGIKIPKIYQRSLWMAPCLQETHHEVINKL